MEGMQSWEDLKDLVLPGGDHYPVAIFNGPICTTTGLYRVTLLDVEEAKELIRTFGFVSAVGHHASAEVISNILEAEVPMNRIEYSQKIGQKAIALKLKIRPPEGVVLSAAEMLQVGFELLLLERLE